MPKVKTHTGAKKRFKLTKNGKVKRAHANKSHILNKKSTKRKRGLRMGAYADKTNVAAIKKADPVQIIREQRKDGGIRLWLVLKEQWRLVREEIKR